MKDSAVGHYYQDINVHSADQEFWLLFLCRSSVCTVLLHYMGSATEDNWKRAVFSPQPPLSSQDKAWHPPPPFPTGLVLRDLLEPFLKPLWIRAYFTDSNSLFKEITSKEICFTKQDLQHPRHPPWSIRFHMPAWNQTINTSRNTWKHWSFCNWWSQ